MTGGGEVKHILGYNHGLARALRNGFGVTVLKGVDGAVAGALIQELTWPAGGLILAW